MTVDIATHAPRTVDIRLAPSEVVDRVEDMLAWLAVSDQAQRPSYVEVGDLCRADPRVMIGGNAWGRLTPSSLLVDETASMAGCCDFHSMFPGGAGERAMANGLRPLLDGLGERLSFARLTEHSDTDPVFAAVRHDWGDPLPEEHFIRRGDVMSLVQNAKWALDSVAEQPTQYASIYRAKLRWPQTARVFCYQTVVAFRDGLSSHGLVPFCYADGQFFHGSRRPDGKLQPMRIQGRPDLPHPILDRTMGLIAAQATRRNEWVVEVSLSPDRTGVGLATDAEGTRAFIAMMNGKSTRQQRRQTLVHWVTEHMRASRKTGDPHLVRAHLRGKQIVRAGDYYAHIWPSRVDIERACNGKRFDLTREVTQ